MKKRLATTLLAGVMAASMAVPAMASSGGSHLSSTGTEVWAGITLEDPEAKVKVTVPTLFAFVVSGSVTADNSALTSTGSGKNILLPNVRVTVDTPSTGPVGSGTGAVYSLQFTDDGTGNMPITNYSTSLQDDGSGGTIRKGLSVKINGNIKNEDTDAERHYWKHVGTSEITTTADGFKKYNVSIDGKPFNTVASGGLEMENGGITLPAPNIDPAGDGSNGNLDASDHAINGEIHYANFDVKIGGVRDMYKQVEASSKVGIIVWTVSAQQTADVDTAPTNPWQQQP